jgi:two-component system, HptB-dependent secretion and biofilm response regulator
MTPPIDVVASVATTLRPVSSTAYRVLVVDDHPQAQAVLDRLLTRIGYRVEIVDNGRAALESVKRSRPDIVLMDVVMPGMDGYETTERIRAETDGHWLPIVFLSATPDSDALVEALDRGGDDYLVKPISAAVLEVKMLTITRMIALNRELEETNRQLEAYRAADDEENHRAVHVIQQLARTGVSDPAVQHWTMAASVFSGDLIASARTPSGMLKVMLADGAGHGLAAALSALPVTAPFYSMVEKGFTLSSIIEEINRKVRTLLPAERFVAATFMAVDFSERLVKVWNGGTPPICVIGSDGQLLHMGRSRNLALGVADDKLFSGEPELYRYDEPCQIIACSDGLLEAAGWRASEAGMHELVATLGPCAPEARLDVLKALCTPAAGLSPVDDMSVVLITCNPGQHGLPLSVDLKTHEGNLFSDWHVDLVVVAEQLKRIDVVPLLHDIVGRMDPAYARNPKLFLVLSELLSNALDHGVLGLDSHIKLEPDGFKRYEEMRQQKLVALKSGHISARVCGEHFADRAMLRICIRDTGAGFDYRGKLDAPLVFDTPFGRGIPLLSRMCEKVDFGDSGNEVCVLFALDSAGAAQGSEETKGAPSI